MKRVTYMILATVAVAFLGSLNLQAQAPATRIAFINSQQAIDAHPAGAAAREIEQRGVAEITEIQNSLNAIIERAQSGATITPEEQEAAQGPAKTLVADEIEQRAGCRLRRPDHGRQQQTEDPEGELPHRVQRHDREATANDDSERDQDDSARTKAIIQAAGE